MATINPPLTPASGSGVRASVWVLHMALPLLALWLLLAQPDLDLTWEHRPSHFWLVMAVAGVNIALAFQVLRASRLRGDARLLLVGYAFMLAAGFLFLHALATPGVILAQANGGFEIATPVGLALASVFFAIASIELSKETSERIVAGSRIIQWALIAVLVGWGVMSLAGLPPLDESFAERAVGPLRWMAFGAIVLYLVAGIRFLATHRRRPSVMLVALITAVTVLAEAMATIVWARSWHLSWWLWHLLMAAAFGFVAYSAYTQYQREGGSAGIFDGIVTPETAQAIRREYGGALETLTDTLQRSAQSGITDEELELIVAGLRARFSMTEGQTEVLARAARSLATERDQVRRLGALAAIGTDTLVEKGEDELLQGIVSTVGERFAPDVLRIGIAAEEGTSYSDRLGTGPWPESGDRYSQELTVAGERAGIVEFARPRGQFRPQDHSIMDTLVAEMGIALENVRLYRQLDTLFRTYLSPDVAETLRSDPTQAGLGGELVELTALFADLRGFTTFSEATDPALVMETLNRLFAVSVPAILRNGGTIVQFVGDALLAIFDAPRPRPDNAYRAAVAALEMQEAVAADASNDGSTPRFRIGINTGMAVLGNIGSDQIRSYSAIGDAVNVASRLETSADPGTVVIGETTYQAIADRVIVVPLGSLDLKGKEEPVVAYLLEGLA